MDELRQKNPSYFLTDIMTNMLMFLKDYTAQVFKMM